MSRILLIALGGVAHGKQKQWCFLLELKIWQTGDLSGRFVLISTPQQLHSTVTMA